MDPATKTPDDLEAVRTIAAALSPFKKDDQERIIRWAREKVGLSVQTETTPSAAAPPVVSSTPATTSTHHAPPAATGGNIKQFVEQKSPKSDMHFATVVAYYHRFNAPPAERKNSVGAEDLQDACRKADRERLTRPGQTLINAFQAGLLDREDRGKFAINAVGENLVAMALPEPGNGAERPKNRISKAKLKLKKVKRKR
jgi:hypothetical protein